jgi:hypothetical protein
MISRGFGFVAFFASVKTSMMMMTMIMIIIIIIITTTIIMKPFNVEYTSHKVII